MKYLKLDLLTLLISLFILSSCQKSESVGLNVDPANQLTGTLIDTVTITAVTVPEDSLVTNNLVQQPLGYMQNPVFGTTEASTILGLSLPSDSLQVRFGNISGAGLGLDSAILVLRYGDEFYGDSVGSSYTINVHQLNENISNSTTYYNNRNWNYNPSSIGSKTVNRFRLKDSLIITQIRKGKPDTVKKVPSQLRIPVSSSFIMDNFFAAGAAGNFTSNAKFENFIKGLYLTVNNTPTPGGVVFIKPDSSAIELYYRRQQNATEIDTNVLVFPITASAAKTRNNYSGSQVASYINSPNQKKVFVQSLGGLRTKIHFPYLQSLKNLGNIAINRAELVIYTDQETNNNPFAPAQRLMLYHTDIAGQRQEVPDNDIGQINGFGDPRSIHIFGFGGFYDNTKKSYTFNIASYIQDLLKGNLQQYDTFIAPIKNNLIRTSSGGRTPDPRVADIFPSGTTAGQSILGSPLSDNYKMKLNIIYTRLGK